MLLKMYIYVVKVFADLRPEVENKKFRLAAKSMHMSAETASMHADIDDNLCFLEGFIGNSSERVATEKSNSR